MSAGFSPVGILQLTHLIYKKLRQREKKIYGKTMRRDKIKNGEWDIMIHFRFR